MSTNGYTTTLYKAADGWRWHTRAHNGRIVAESGEAYSSKQACKMGYKRVTTHLAHATVFEEK